MRERRIMPYDLFAQFSISWPNAFSALAMTFSASALFAALRLSGQMKRKVDGELGELAPNFALYPLADPRTSEAGRAFELRIDNYNRRPIRITGLLIEQPAKVGLVAYRLEGLNDILLGGMDRPHNQVFTSFVIEGTPPGAPDFNAARVKLVVTGQFPPPERKKGSTLALRVDFELLQEVPEKHSRAIRLHLDPAARRIGPRRHPLATGGLVPAE
jgi:hypothetical protein